MFGTGHGHLGRVALLLQQLSEGIQLVALVQGRETSRLQYITTGNTTAHNKNHGKAERICSAPPHQLHQLVEDRRGQAADLRSA